MDLKLKLKKIGVSMKVGTFANGVIIMMMPQMGNSAEFSVQPRIEAGIMYYEYKQDAFQSPPRDPNGIFPNSASELKYTDYLPFVGGGVTFGADRLFVDFGIRHAFNGSDSDAVRNQNFLEAGEFITTDNVLTQQTSLDADFDRTEWAISIGYGISEHIAVYAGYLRAETDFDTDLTGSIDAFQANDLTPIPFLTGTFTGNLKQELEYDGPFVGVNLTMQVKKGFLDGVLSGNFAIAFLDGKVGLKFRDVLITNQLGQTAPFDLQSAANTQGRGSFSNLEGDTVGISIGATWKGFTPLDGLTYTAGINGYRYEFESDQTASFNEIQVRFNLGLAYSFNI